MGRSVSSTSGICTADDFDLTSSTDSFFPRPFHGGTKSSPCSFLGWGKSIWRVTLAALRPRTGKKHQHLLPWLTVILDCLVVHLWLQRRVFLAAVVFAHCFHAHKNPVLSNHWFTSVYSPSWIILRSFSLTAVIA